MDSAGVVGFSWASAVLTTLAITVTVRHRSNPATVATFNPTFLGMSFLFFTTALSRTPLCLRLVSAQGAEKRRSWLRLVREFLRQRHAQGKPLRRCRAANKRDELTSSPCALLKPRIASYNIVEKPVVHHSILAHPTSAMGHSRSKKSNPHDLECQLRPAKRTNGQTFR
jgi:hypothetical protein